MQGGIPLSRTPQCLNMDQIHLHSAYICGYCSGWMDLEWAEERNPAHNGCNGLLRNLLAKPFLTSFVVCFKINICI